MSKRRIYLPVFLVILGFVTGYYNEPLSLYFANYQALCGLLTAVILLLVFYILTIQNKREREKGRYERLESTIEQDRFSNKIVNEKLTQMEARVNGKFSELKSYLDLIPHKK